MDSLSYVLSHTASILTKQADQVLQERLGVGMSQFKILMVLQDHPNLQQRQLAETLGQTEASISRQIKLLLEKGMLMAATNPDNRRQHLTALTSKGIKVTQAAEDILDDFHGSAFGHLSAKQQQQLNELLGAMHRHTCQEGKPYACEHGSHIAGVWNAR